MIIKHNGNIAYCKHGLLFCKLTLCALNVMCIFYYNGTLRYWIYSCIITQIDFITKIKKNLEPEVKINTCFEIFQCQTIFTV